MENDELLGSEYNNMADLMGINTDGAQELLGRINRLPKDKQTAVLKRLLKRPPITVGSNTSRQEFDEKFEQLPKEIQKALYAKRMQLVDTRFYIIKEISGKQSIDAFQGTDNKNVGLANLANQKLEKDNWFLLSAIRMTYGESVEGREGKEKVEYKEIPAIIANGEFELEAGQKKIVGLITNEVFDTRNRSDSQIGYYKLHNTKVIEPQVEIKMPIKFSASVNPNSFLKIVFIGSSVVPY